MTKFKLRTKALHLRKQGKSYSQIKKEIRVSKGILSVWLKNYPLSKERISELRDRNAKRIERFRLTMQTKRNTRLNFFYELEKKNLLPLSDKEFYIAGLFLYWGEGTKGLQTKISINNTDPDVLKFALYWLNKSLKIPYKKITVNLHLYKDMDTSTEIEFWSKELGLPLKQFRKPYIKKTVRNKVDHKGFGHGTCGLSLNNVRLKEKIIMGIKVLGDHYGNNI